MALSGNEPLKESFLEYLADSVTAYRNKDEVEVFAVRTLAENRHIGNCALYAIDREAGEAQLGISLGERDCWGRGYGADAVKCLVRYAFDGLKLLRVRLKTLEHNSRARRCFEKCGFTPCGALLLDGRSYILMELNSSDYLMRQARPGGAG